VLLGGAAALASAGLSVADTIPWRICGYIFTKPMRNTIGLRRPEIMKVMKASAMKGFMQYRQSTICESAEKKENTVKNSGGQRKLGRRKRREEDGRHR
jgi:hypothetical protein